MSDPFSEGKPAPAPEPAPVVTPAPAAPPPARTIDTSYVERTNTDNVGGFTPDLATRQAAAMEAVKEKFPNAVFAGRSPEEQAADETRTREIMAMNKGIAGDAAAETAAVVEYDYSLPTTQVGPPATKGKKPGAMFMEDGVWKPLKLFGGKEKTSVEREAFAEIMARADDLRLRLEQVLASKKFLLDQLADADEMEAAIRKAQAGLTEEAQKRLMEVLTG